MSARDYIGWVAILPAGALLWHLYFAVKYQEIRAPKGTIRRADEPFKFWFALIFTLCMFAFVACWLADGVTQ